MSKFKLDLDTLGLDGAKEAYLKLHQDEVPYKSRDLRFELYFDDLNSLELCDFICDFNSLNRLICFQKDRKNLCIKISVPPMIHSLMVLIEDILPYTTKYIRLV
jgi:hypothetical protein